MCAAAEVSLIWFWVFMVWQLQSVCDQLTAPHSLFIPFPAQAVLAQTHDWDQADIMMCVLACVWEKGVWSWRVLGASVIKMSGQHSYTLCVSRLESKTTLLRSNTAIHKEMLTLAQEILPGCVWIYQQDALFCLLYLWTVINVIILYLKSSFMSVLLQ